MYRAMTDCISEVCLPLGRAGMDCFLRFVHLDVYLALFRIDLEMIIKLK